MKKQILLFISLVLLAVQAWAAPVDLSQAQFVAQNFTATNGGFYAPSPNGGLRLAYAEQSSKIKDQPVFYVFNAADSYVIVAGDDRAESILGYGEGQFDINDIPCGMRDLFEIYKEEIEFLQTHPKLQVQNNSQGTPSLTATSVSPLLNTAWGQGSPYYNHCPKYGGKFCLTGCVATAMAQIMQYWKYPSSSPKINSYHTDSLNILVEELPSKTFKYSNQSDDDIAWLMSYAGQSVEMDYTPDGSGSNIYKAKNAMVNTFKYSTSAQIKTKGSDDNQWHTLLKTELNAGHPVYYRASHRNADDTYSGHAFVIDGYNSAGKYHINWGWNGLYSKSNDWFALNAFNPGSYKFNYKQAMIVDLRPKTVVSAPSSKTFSSKTVGNTYTLSFTVKGTYLTGGLTLKLTGATDVFSISRTSITKSAATSGATVTVTYKPTAAGTKTATITISGGGLTSNKTISLSGTAVVRKITPSVTKLAFGNKNLYTSTTKKFKVTGTNLNAPIKLTLSGSNKGMFKINKTSISASEAASGVYVTVTYKPTAIGIHTAKITLSSGDVTSKTVNLTGKGISNGTGISPYSRVDETMTTDLLVVDFLNGDDLETTGREGGNGDVMYAPNTSTTDVNELAMDSKVYAVGQNIIIESPIDQSAVISDISGRAWSVSLQAGHNEIPVNASGIYIVRIREKTTKLMLK